MPGADRDGWATSGFHLGSSWFHHYGTSGITHHVALISHGWPSHVHGRSSHIWWGSTCHLGHMYRCLVLWRGPHVTAAKCTEVFILEIFCGMTYLRNAIRVRVNIVLWVYDLSCNGQQSSSPWIIWTITQKASGDTSRSWCGEENRKTFNMFISHRFRNWVIAKQSVPRIQFKLREKRLMKGECFSVAQ